MKDFKDTLGRESGRVKEKVGSRELGCQAAVKFHMSSFNDLRIYLVYVLIAACCFLILLAQLLPLRSLDRNQLPCSDSVSITSPETNLDSPIDPLSELFLHEKISNKSSLDISKGELRVFKPHGLATHMFIEMGAYRGGPRTFSVVGLIAKPIETFHKPPYSCEWVSSAGRTFNGRASKILPDWNYGRLYTVVVITCTFRVDVGVQKEGGELVLQVSYGDQFRQPEKIVVLTEKRGQFNATIFNPPYPYDYVYCGSSLYGDVSPQRMREWLAYHAHFFGERSHFMFHDAGGFHQQVWEVLEPWIQKGRVSVQNIRQQEIYDGYYHNQFLTVNDCLFRSRFMANWTFFFDVDEYLYVPPTTTLEEVLNDNPNVTQITFEQVPISNNLCVADNITIDGHAKKWAIEKLVYRKILRAGIRYDRKYAVQARYAAATGVHMSMNMRKGKNAYPKGDKIRYYHYHDTINKRKELCQAFVPPQNKTSLQRYQRQNYRLDETMANLSHLIKGYERKTIGSPPFIV